MVEKTSTRSDMNPVTVTVELARELHPSLGRNRLYFAMRADVLEHYKVGKRMAIPVDALNEWVRSGAPVKPLSDDKKLKLTP
jgi:hypothetical protein